MTPDQREKLKNLPQWVQKEFARQENINQRLRILIETMEGDRYGQIEVYTKGHTFRLPADARITFNFNTFNKMQLYFGGNNDELQLYGDVQGIAVIPEATNHIHIKPKMWRREGMYEDSDS